MKQELIDKLIEILEHEYRVYENIHRISKDKTNIIVEGKVSELDNVVKLEQALVLQISRIDKQREEIISRLSNEVNAVESLNISEIRKHANMEQNNKLEAYQNKMNSLVNELTHVNQLNSKLIKNSLEFIEFSLNLMSNADVVSNNYGQKGETSQKARKNRFDMKL